MSFVIFGRVLGAIGFGDLNLRIVIESDITAFIGKVRRDDTAFSVVAEGSKSDNAYLLLD